jgi:transcriptional regulator of acetoin/glycerol metabolism
MDKTIREAAQILQRISNRQRKQRDWQRCCRDEQNDKSKPKVSEVVSDVKMNRRSRKMNRPYEKLKIHFPR